MIYKALNKSATNNHSLDISVDNLVTNIISCKDCSIINVICVDVIDIQSINLIR